MTLRSPVLWFFSVVSGPLTRPMRAFLSPATLEPRVRMGLARDIKDCKSAEEVNTRRAALAGRPLTVLAHRR